MALKYVTGKGKRETNNTVLREITAKVPIRNKNPENFKQNPVKHFIWKMLGNYYKKILFWDILLLMKRKKLFRVLNQLN